MSLTSCSVGGWTVGFGILLHCEYLLYPPGALRGKV